MILQIVPPERKQSATYIDGDRINVMVRDKKKIVEVERGSKTFSFEISSGVAAYIMNDQGKTIEKVVCPYKTEN